MKTLRLLASFGAVLVLASGCATTAPAPTGPQTQAPMEDAGIPEILNFSAPQLDGDTVDGADYAGKDVALWFWAPW